MAGAHQIGLAAAFDPVAAAAIGRNVQHLDLAGTGDGDTVELHQRGGTQNDRDLLSHEIVRAIDRQFVDSGTARQLVNQNVGTGVGSIGADNQRVIAKAADQRVHALSTGQNIVAKSAIKEIILDQG